MGGIGQNILREMAEDAEGPCKISKLELRKCVMEITDLLFFENEPFKGWYMTLKAGEDNLLDEKLFEILDRRINRGENKINKHKFKKDE